MDAAKERGERAVRAICAAVDANELERRTIASIEARVRHGYKFIDLRIRKDGQEYHYEADWLARLLRFDGDEAADRIEALERENAALREALELAMELRPTLSEAWLGSASPARDSAHAEADAIEASIRAALQETKP